MPTHNATTALFEDPGKAAAAVDELLERGVPAGDISVVATEPTANDAFSVDTHSRVAEGAAIGAGTGGAIGALVVGFTTIGALTATGVGLVAVGPVIAALAGAGAGAATGGVVGGLVGLGIPEHEVKYYEEALHRGSVLVGVDDAALSRGRVEEILNKHDADRVTSP